MKFLSNLKKKELAGKTCLLRIDLNIKDSELKSSGLQNNLRIQAVLPTINFLIKNGAKVVLLSHCGRPELGKWKMENGKWKAYTLKPFVRIFSKLLKTKIKFIDIFTSMYASKDFYKVREIIKSSNNKVFLLENLRFFKGEEKNDAKFAKDLAKLGDIYINDAFAVSHRANASVEAITKFIPSYAGLLLEKEINNLNEILRFTQDDNKHPFVVILGGIKISDKIGLINSFMKKADYFLIGGGIANNFLKAQGLPIGDSVYEDSKIEYAKKLLNNKKIILPVDYVIENRKILDIGPNTVNFYVDIIKKAKIIIWNGPMGHAEDKRFQKASDCIKNAILKSKAFAVAGGGETATLFNDLRLAISDKQLFISTGGGAMLEYLAGKKLPGIKALK